MSVKYLILFIFLDIFLANNCLYQYNVVFLIVTLKFKENIFEI